MQSASGRQKLIFPEFLTEKSSAAAAAAPPKRGRGRPPKIRVTMPPIHESSSSAAQEGGGVHEAENADDLHVDIVQEDDGWVTVIRKKKRKQQAKPSCNWTREMRQTLREEGDLYKMSVADFIDPVHHVAPPQPGLPIAPPLIPPAPPIPEVAGADDFGGGDQIPDDLHDDDQHDDNDPDYQNAAAAGDPGPDAENFEAGDPNATITGNDDDDDEFYDVDEDLAEPTPKKTPRKVRFGPVTERRRQAGEPHLTLGEAEFIARATEQSPGRSPRGGGRSTRSAGHSLSPSILSKYLFDARRKKK